MLLKNKLELNNSTIGNITMLDAKFSSENLAVNSILLERERETNNLTKKDLVKKYLLFLFIYKKEWIPIPDCQV